MYQLFSKSYFYISYLINHDKSSVLDIHHIKIPLHAYENLLMVIVHFGYTWGLFGLVVHAFLSCCITDDSFLMVIVEQENFESTFGVRNDFNLLMMA